MKKKIKIGLICFLLAGFILSSGIVFAVMESPIQDSGGEVIITTDKAEYSQGEAVKITVENNISQSIFYERQIGCGLSFWRLETNESGKWQNKQLDEICRWDIAGPLITELKPGDRITNGWNLKNKDRFIGSGNYRISFNYGLDEKYYWERKDNGQKIIYSPEFAVREKQEP